MLGKCEKKLPASIMWAAVIAFGLLALFGLPLSMTTNEHGQMANCPFMSQVQVFCQMGAGEHVREWQRAITGIPQKFFDVAITGLLVLLGWHFVHILRQGSAAIAETVQRLRRRRKLAKCFNFLELALAQGILHPKVW